MRQTPPHVDRSTPVRACAVTRAALSLVVSLALAACGAGECAPGESVSCACDGATETVTCKDDGTQPPCVCGGSGGAGLDGGGNMLTSGSLTWPKGAGTVFDSASGLMWQRTPAADKHTWDGAVAYCEDLELETYDDWKLPHRDQLESIVLSLTTTPSIDTTAFPDTPAKPFWTRTLYGPNAAQEAFGVDFENGGTGHALMSEPHYVRCVRTPPLR